jgi:hypothetical protein
LDFTVVRNILNIRYTGTEALKSDFTRKGERNLIGVSQDAFKSLSRFYHNNLKDGFRQMAIDLALGNIELADSSEKGE